MELFPHTVTCPSSRDWRHVRTPPSQFQTIRHVTTDHKKTTSKTEKEMPWSRRSHDLAKHHLNSWRVRQEFPQKTLKSHQCDDPEQLPWWFLWFLRSSRKRHCPCRFTCIRTCVCGCSPTSTFAGFHREATWYGPYPSSVVVPREDLKKGPPKQGKCHGHDKHKKRMIGRCCEVESEMGRSVKNQKLKHTPAKAYTIHIQPAHSPQQSGHSVSSTHSDERTPESSTHSNLS